MKKLTIKSKLRLGISLFLFKLFLLSFFIYIFNIYFLPEPTMHGTQFLDPKVNAVELIVML